MVYNLTAVSNTTGLLHFIGQIDNHIFCLPSACGGEGGLLGLMIVLIIAGVLMFNFISNGKDLNSSVMATSFICLMIGGLFYLMGIISEMVLYITLIIWGISVALGRAK